LTRHTHHLKVEVLKKDGYWLGLPIDAPGSASGDTLPELFAEVEFSKHFYADVTKDTPVCVEYVAGWPEIHVELAATFAAFMALPPHLRPQAVAWDHANGRPVIPAHTGPYLNLDQMSAYL
jgi:hypothetical protein